jgi:adenylosuccinate lyase
MLDRTRAIAEGLVVYGERMKANLERAAELFFSEAVLLALVESGMARQEAYVFVQRNAMRAWQGDGSFRKNLAGDADVLARIDEKRLDALFDLDHALRFAPEIVERALRA